MNIGIIGGGYVGSLLAQSLTAHHVTVATRTRPGTIHLDIYDQKALYSFCNGLDVLVITMTPDRLFPPLPLVRQIIYTSSTSVYQDQATVDESSPTNNSILAQIEKQFPPTALIFRCSGIYGPGREIKNRIKSPMAGTGNEPTNSIHVDDVIGAIIFSIENKLRGVYNLCQDDHPTRRELYNKFTDIPLKFDPALPLRHGGHKTVSNKKIKQASYELKHPHFYSA